MWFFDDATYCSDGKRKYFTTDLVSIDQLVTCIVDLEVEIDILKEKIQEMKEPYEDDPYDKWRDSQWT